MDKYLLIFKVLENNSFLVIKFFKNCVCLLLTKTATRPDFFQNLC